MIAKQEVAEDNRDHKCCHDCGSKDNTVFVSDPYLSDIHEDHTKRWLCESCIDESMADI